MFLLNPCNAKIYENYAIMVPLLQVLTTDDINSSNLAVRYTRN